MKGFQPTFILILLCAIATFATLVSCVPTQTSAKFNIAQKTESGDQIFYVRYLIYLNETYQNQWGILQDELPPSLNPVEAQRYCESLNPSAGGENYREGKHAGVATISNINFNLADSAETFNDLPADGLLRTYNLATKTWDPLAPTIEYGQVPRTIGPATWARQDFNSFGLQLATCPPATGLLCIPDIYDLSDVRPEDTLCSNVAPTDRVEHYFATFSGSKLSSGKTRIRAQAYPNS